MNSSTIRSVSRWAYPGLVFGFLLLLLGTFAVISYLGLPLLLGDDLLGAQLGQMAAIFLGLGGGGMLFFHSLRALGRKSSRPLRLPPAHFFLIAFAVVLGLGNVLLNYDVAVGYIFPIAFLLGAALPTLGVLAWSGRRLAWPVSWRQGSTAMVIGSTISVTITLLFGALFSGLIYIFFQPVAFIAESFAEFFGSGGPGFLERLFLSPYIFVFLLITALQAPIPEELAKAVGPAVMNHRLDNERQAFMVGLAAGAGFAILENMLYEGLYAQWSGWSWGGITLLRAIGSVLHPLCTGIIGLALFRDRERGIGWFGRVARAYVFAVIIHTLWNGGFDALLYMTGIDYYSGAGRSLDIYGESIAVLLIAYLIVLSLGLWWLLRSIVISMATDSEPRGAPTTISARALGLVAFVTVLVIVPIGALLGPAWVTIQNAMGLGSP